MDLTSESDHNVYIYPWWTRVVAVGAILGVSLLSLWLVTAAILKLSGVTE